MSSGGQFFLGNQLTLSTWLLLGASLQALLGFILPPRIAILPALLLLLVRFVPGALIAKSVLPNPYLQNAKLGRWSSSIMSGASGSGFEKAVDEGVVVFLLGVCANQYVRMGVLKMLYMNCTG